jgi:hypothetical protein
MCQQVEVKIQHQLPFRTEPYLLKLHGPGKHDTVRAEQQQQVRMGNAGASRTADAEVATSTLSRIRTQACVSDSTTAVPAMQPQRSQSEPHLTGHDTRQRPVSDAVFPDDEPAGQTALYEGTPATDTCSSGSRRDLRSRPDEAALQASVAVQGGHVRGRAQVASCDQVGWAGTKKTAMHERPHKLQTWFGIEAFITLIPCSYSRRVLNEEVQDSGHADTTMSPAVVHAKELPGIGTWVCAACLRTSFVNHSAGRRFAHCCGSALSCLK